MCYMASELDNWCHKSLFVNGEQLLVLPEHLPMKHALKDHLYLRKFFLLLGVRSQNFRRQLIKRLTDEEI